MDSRILTLTLSCNNKSLTIGKNTPVRLMEYEGLEAPDGTGLGIGGHR